MFRNGNNKATDLLCRFQPYSVLPLKNFNEIEQQYQAIDRYDVSSISIPLHSTEFDLIQVPQHLQH